MVVVVCAWCDRLMDKDGGGQVLVSHGICKACTNRLDWRESPVLVVSRRHAGLVPVLSQLLHGHPHIEVFVDRRTSERRTGNRGIHVERRGCPDRRRSGSPLVLA